MAKRIFGYIFIVLAVIIGIVFLLSCKELYSDIITVFQFFTTDSIDANALGYSLGSISGHAIIFIAALCLFIIGRKWIGAKK